MNTMSFENNIIKRSNKYQRYCIVLSIVLLVLAVFIFLAKTRTPQVKTVKIKSRPSVEQQRSDSRDVQDKTQLTNQ